MLLVLCKIVNFSISTEGKDWLWLYDAGTHGTQNTWFVQEVLPVVSVVFKPIFFLLCSLSLL